MQRILIALSLFISTYSFSMQPISPKEGEITSVNVPIYYANGTFTIRVNRDRKDDYNPDERILFRLQNGFTTYAKSFPSTGMYTETSVNRP